MIAIVIQTNAAREKRPDQVKTKIAKEVGVFQEKGALFRQLYVKASQVDDLFINFNLRKIGVDGQVEIERRTQANFGVQTDIAIGSRGDTILGIPIGSSSHKGDESIIARSVFRPFIKLKCPSPAQVSAIKLQRNLYPGTEMPPVGVVANEVDAPFFLAIFEAQDAQGNGELGGPVIGIILYFTPPYIVPTFIGFTATGGGNQRLGLNSSRSKGKKVTIVGQIDGIEHDGNTI